jgi:hypothetical protein
MPDPQTSDPRYPTSDAPWQGPRQPLDAGTVVTGLSATTPRYPRTILPTLPTTGRPDTPLPNPELQQSLWQRITHDPIGAATEAIRGAVVGGGGDTQAAKAGELAMAAMPLVGGAKALVTGRNALTAGEEAAQGIRAYHGSPHDFDRFDISKIGTGQGAASYGRGIYFAGAEPTAETYRASLSTRPDVFVGGQLVPSTPATPSALFLGKDADQMIATRLATKAHQYASLGRPLAVEDALSMIDGELENGLNNAIAQKDSTLYNTLRDQRLSLHRMQEAGVSLSKPGHMYEVNLNVDPQHLLAWDKPLREQSPHIQQAFAGQQVGKNPTAWQWQPHQVTPADVAAGTFGPSATPGQWTVVQRDAGGAVRYHSGTLGSRSAADTVAQARAEMSAGHARDYGEALYQDLATQLGDPSAASARLRDAGVPGVQYLDQLSRAKENPEYLQRELADLQTELTRRTAPYPRAGMALEDPWVASLQDRIASVTARLAEANKPQTSNYVMFDDKKIAIMRKYGLLPPLAAGAAYGASRNQVGTPPPVQPVR